MINQGFLLNFMLFLLCVASEISVVAAEKPVLLPIKKRLFSQVSASQIANNIPQIPIKTSKKRGPYKKFDYTGTDNPECKKCNKDRSLLVGWMRELDMPQEAKKVYGLLDYCLGKMRDPNITQDQAQFHKTWFEGIYEENIHLCIVECLKKSTDGNSASFAADNTQATPIKSSKKRGPYKKRNDNNTDTPDCEQYYDDRSFLIGQMHKVGMSKELIRKAYGLLDYRLRMIRNPDITPDEAQLHKKYFKAIYEENMQLCSIGSLERHTDSNDGTVK